MDFDFIPTFMLGGLSFCLWLFCLTRSRRPRMSRASSGRVILKVFFGFALKPFVIPRIYCCVKRKGPCLPKRHCLLYGILHSRKIRKSPNQSDGTVSKQQHKRALSFRWTWASESFQHSFYNSNDQQLLCHSLTRWCQLYNISITQLVD